MASALTPSSAFWRFPTRKRPCGFASSSPTIRVGGRDVDPHGERSDYALSCRVFRTGAGISGQPDERWVREALLREAMGG